MTDPHDTAETIALAAFLALAIIAAAGAAISIAWGAM